MLQFCFVTVSCCFREIEGCCKSEYGRCLSWVYFFAVKTFNWKWGYLDMMSPEKKSPFYWHQLYTRNSSIQKWPQKCATQLPLSILMKFSYRILILFNSLCIYNYSVSLKKSSYKYAKHISSVDIFVCFVYVCGM